MPQIFPGQFVTSAQIRGPPSCRWKAWGVKALTPPRLFLEQPLCRGAALGGERSGQRQRFCPLECSAAQAGDPSRVSLRERDAVPCGPQQDEERGARSRSSPNAAASRLSEVRGCELRAPGRGTLRRDGARVRNEFLNRNEVNGKFEKKKFRSGIPMSPAPPSCSGGWWWRWWGTLVVWSLKKG